MTETPGPLDGAGAELMEGSPDGIAVLDGGGVVVAWNAAATRMFGIDRSRAIGQELASLIFPSQLQAAVRELLGREPAAAEAPSQHEIELIASDADGQTVQVELSTAVIGAAELSLLAVYLHKGGERAKVSDSLAEERLRHLADHDEQTGLLNRRGFELTADAAIADDGLPAGRGAMVVIDLDHLRRVNDTLGRSTGDRIVMEIARLLQAQLGAGYVLGRLEGDEFGLLVPWPGEEKALERAADLLSAVRSRNGTAAVTASAGIAMVEPDANINSADLLTAAGIALHQAKEHGRNRAVAFTGKDRDRLEWVGHVRNAIEEQRLILYSQPIVDIATGTAWTEELLVRMLDPVTGNPIVAAAFIPAAERFGLIRDLDHWVMTQALALVTSGRRVSANISASSIGDRELTDMIARGLEAGGADASLLTIELTETAATPTIEALRDFTSRVEQLGCGLSLDDVGTGFGSLTYLRHLPFTELKIDMQFVRGVVESNADARIVESLVSIARGLGIRTVAEGVEDETLIGPLRELGVDCAQGFVFGRPEPIKTPALARPEASWPGPAAATA